MPAKKVDYTIQCPNWLDPAVQGEQVMGCGSTDLYYDLGEDDGMYDCNNCGIWFYPERPPES